MSKYNIELELRKAAVVSTAWGLLMRNAADELHELEKTNNVFFKYVDRLFDPTDTDTLEKVVSELAVELNKAMAEM